MADDHFLHNPVADAAVGEVRDQIERSYAGGEIPEDDILHAHGSPPGGGGGLEIPQIGGAGGVGRIGAPPANPPPPPPLPQESFDCEVHNYTKQLLATFMREIEAELKKTVMEKVTDAVKGGLDEEHITSAVKTTAIPIGKRHLQNLVFNAVTNILNAMMGADALSVTLPRIVAGTHVCKKPCQCPKEVCEMPGGSGSGGAAGGAAGGPAPPQGTPPGQNWNDFNYTIPDEITPNRGYCQLFDADLQDAEHQVLREAIASGRVSTRRGPLEQRMNLNMRYMIDPYSGAEIPLPSASQNPNMAAAYDAMLADAGGTHEAEFNLDDTGDFERLEQMMMNMD